MEANSVPSPPDLQMVRPLFLIVHDYFGISDATKESVKHLGALGYLSVAVDLYGGKSATSHEEAVKLMQSLDRKATDKILQAGLDYLKQSGRKVATIGFSMGGQESLSANLNDPEAVSATLIIYGSGFDKIDTKRLERLKALFWRSRAVRILMQCRQPSSFSPT